MGMILSGTNGALQTTSDASQIAAGLESNWSINDPGCSGIFLRYEWSSCS